MRFDQCAGHCIVSNFWLHGDSHSQILTSTETPSAPTLARSNLIRLSSWLTVMTSLTCCISIVASPPCGSSSFPACRGYVYTAYTSLACVAFATILHFQTLAVCQATTWLVVTRPATGHPSSLLSPAIHQSNFAILAICPHTTILETQLNPFVRDWASEPPWSNNAWQCRWSVLFRATQNMQSRNQSVYSEICHCMLL